MGRRFTFSPHYTYRISDEDIDVVRDLDLERLRVVTNRHETGVSTSYRLWDTSSVGVSYDYFSGRIPAYAGARLVEVTGHSGTASFTWPYTRNLRGNRRKLSVFPGLFFHLSDLSQDMGRRPLATSRLTMAYEVFHSWKVELMGEFRYDDNEDLGHADTEESRLWLLWKSEWK